MRPLASQLRSIQDALDALAGRHQVPGATLAVGRGDELFDFATGVLNLSTGVETTTGSVFQIGSNTKVFTTTLIMQLVDSGQVELDAPVRRYLPDFALADPTAADEITVRQLLNHTSGIQGDYFTGFGRGDEAIERYVDSLADIDLVHRPGQMWSYCNSGFVVAGRVAEVLASTPYNKLLKERICRPLGLEHTTVLTEEIVAERCAVGHVPGPGGRPMVPPGVVVMGYSHAPAGSRTTSTAAELVRFAQMHLSSGTAPDGEQVLSAASVAAMQQVGVSKPVTSTGPLAQGLGWAIEDWDSKRVIGHNGGTIGQTSFLRAVPDDDLVVALLTNSAASTRLWADLGSWLFEELAGLKMATALQVPAKPPELSLARYEGTYERLGVRRVVAEEDGGLVMRTELIDIPEELRPAAPPPPLKLRAIDESRFGGWVSGAHDIVVFMEFERGRPGYLFVGGRVARRKGRPSSARTPVERLRRPSRDRDGRS